MKRLTLIVTLLTIAGCTDPFISIPGGELSGEPAAVPTSWPTLPDVVQLEVRPDDPYSLNIWAVNAGNHIYVATNEAKWVPYINEDARVRLKVDDTLYMLEAELVTEAAELEQISAAYTAKYDWGGGDETGEDSGPANVFRLVAR